MSGFKPIGSELLYACYQAATTSTPTASPGSSMVIGYPPIVIPAGYFSNTGSWSSSLKLEMGGLASVTAVVWQFFLYGAVATTTAPAFATTAFLGSSASFTPGATVTNNWWDATIHIGLRTLALGALSTVSATGKFRCPSFASAAYAAGTPFEIPFPATGAYTPFGTYDTTQSYVVWPAVAITGAVAANTVTTQYVKLYGES